MADYKVLLYSPPLLKKADRKAKKSRHNYILNGHKVGLYSTRFLYCPCATHACLVKILVLYKHSYSVNQKPRTIKSYFMTIQYIVMTHKHSDFTQRVKVT
jgi:hypothetical protein